MEDKQRYRVLKSSQKPDGTPIVLIGDIESHPQGEAGVESLRHAFNANARPLSKGGVLALDAKQLHEFVSNLEGKGFDKSEAALKTALASLEKRTLDDSTKRLATAMKAKGFTK